MAGESVHQEADEGPVTTMLWKMAIWRYQIPQCGAGPLSAHTSTRQCQ
jgi:hypothetical protein